MSYSAERLRRLWPATFRGIFAIFIEPAKAVVEAVVKQIFLNQNNTFYSNFCYRMSRNAQLNSEIHYGALLRATELELVRFSPN